MTFCRPNELSERRNLYYTLVYRALCYLSRLYFVKGLQEEIVPQLKAILRPPQRL